MRLIANFELTNQRLISRAFVLCTQTQLFLKQRLLAAAIIIFLGKYFLYYDRILIYIIQWI